MNIRDLEYLAALAEHRHFRRAAAACNIGQPTLSEQIQKLELELGIPFLEKDRRKVRFTPFGLLLVEQANLILREVKTLQNMAIAHKKGLSGNLYLGVQPTVGAYLLPHLTPSLHQAYPHLKLYLHEAQTNTLLSMLNKGQLDCALLSVVKEVEPFTVVPLFDEPLKLAIPKQHPWNERQTVHFNELASEKLLMLENDESLRTQIQDLFVQQGLKKDPYFSGASLETLRNMVSAGNGIAFIPELAVLSEATHENVKYLQCLSPEPTRTIALVYRPGAQLKKEYDQLAKVLVRLIHSLNLKELTLYHP